MTADPVRRPGVVRDVVVVVLLDPSRQPDRHRTHHDQHRHGDEQGTPARQCEQPQQCATTDDHPDPVGTHLDAVADPALGRTQQAHRQAVGGDVLGGGEEIDNGDTHEQPRQRGGQDQGGQDEHHGGRQELQGEEPPAPGTVPVHHRGPQELQRPRGEEDAGRADRGQREPRLAQDHGQGLGEKAVRQALREVQAGQQNYRAGRNDRGDPACAPGARGCRRHGEKAIGSPGPAAVRGDLLPPSDGAHPRSVPRLGV